MDQSDESLVNLAPKTVKNQIKVLESRLTLLRMANNVSRLEKPLVIRRMRRTKARSLTILRSLSLNEKV